MNMLIRQIEEGDLEYVRANPFQEVVKEYPELTAPDDSFTAIFDDEIVAVGGVQVFDKDMGMAWVMLTKDARKEGVFGVIAFSAIRKKLEELIAEYALCICFAQARVDFPKACRMIDALGFKEVCIRKGYCHDKADMILYQKVTDEPI